MHLSRHARVFAAHVQSIDVAKARHILNVRQHGRFLDKNDHVTAQNTRPASPEARNGLNPTVIVILLIASLFHKNNTFERIEKNDFNQFL